jgi:hypothetical protein
MPEEAHEFSLISTRPAEDYKIFFKDKMIYSCFFSLDLKIKNSPITCSIHSAGRDNQLES